MKNLTDTQKLTTGLVLLLVAMALITAGCGYTWGTAGALVGCGLVTLGYGYSFLASVDK